MSGRPSPPLWLGSFGTPLSYNGGLPDHNQVRLAPWQCHLGVFDILVDSSSPAPIMLESFWSWSPLQCVHR